MAVLCSVLPNLTALSGNINITAFSNTSHLATVVLNFTQDEIPPTYSQYKRTKVVLDTYVIPVICLIGLLGNILNIIVLSRRRLYLSLEKLESSVHTGLLALAVSDMLFCISVLPHAFRDRQHFRSASIDFWLLYNTYSAAVINTWLLCSAWITVTLAVCRYLAVCRPLQTQCSSHSIGRIVAVVVLCSVLLNLPRYWSETITWVPCIEGGRLYYAVNGPLQGTTQLIYMWMYFVLAIVVPVIILIYCTAHLIMAFKKSQKLRNQHKPITTTMNSSKNIVTYILCVIVIFYVILVIPAEIIIFVKYFMGENYSFTNSMHYSLAVSVCNALQAINFSFNFMLYCIINVHFRKVTRDIMSHLLPGSCSKSPSGGAMIEMAPLRRNTNSRRHGNGKAVTY